MRRSAYLSKAYQSFLKEKYAAMDKAENAMDESSQAAKPKSVLKKLYAGILSKIPPHSNPYIKVLDQHGQVLYVFNRDSLENKPTKSLLEAGALRYVLYVEISEYGPGKRLPTIKEESMEELCSDSCEDDVSTQGSEKDVRQSYLKGYELKFSERVTEKDRLLTLIELMRELYLSGRGNGKIS